MRGLRPGQGACELSEDFTFGLDLRGWDLVPVLPTG